MIGQKNIQGGKSSWIHTEKNICNTHFMMWKHIQKIGIKKRILGSYSLSGEYTPFLKNFLGINSWNSFAGWAKRYL